MSTLSAERLDALVWRCPVCGAWRFRFQPCATSHGETPDDIARALDEARVFDHPTRSRSSRTPLRRTA